MSDIQENGQSTTASINKQVETLACNNEPPCVATSNSQVKTQNSCNKSREQRRINPAAEKYGNEHISNLKKQRYWNSWEELHLVELWRRCRDEVTQINVPLPVYQKMMIAMRSRNMIVTTRDCRRKINTLHTRYKQELKRVETTGCKSEWRLFPLIHCVLQPKIKDYDPWHENKIVTKLLDELPKPVIEKPPPAPVIQSSPRQPDIRSKNTRPVSQPSGRNSRQHLSNYNKDNSVHKSHGQALPILFPSSSFCEFEKPSILPFRYITMQKIEQLRQDNNRLSAQRDDDLKCLHMEEENFRSFENFIRMWSEKKELELNRVKLLAQQNVSNMENGENHNMEQQLQETESAK